AGAAWLLGALLCAHGPLLVQSAQASTDVPALALGLAALLAARAGPPLGTRRVFACGVLAGFATGVRYQMALLVPALLSAGLASPGRGRRLAALAAGGALGYLPHAVVSCAVFGWPWHSQSWRNLPLKIVYGFDAMAMAAGLPENARPWPFLTEHWRD